MREALAARRWAFNWTTVSSWAIEERHEPPVVWPFGGLPSIGDLTTCPQANIHYTIPMSVKEQVLQAIQRLPNDVDFRDVADEIALLAAVQEAERDIQDGRLISNGEMKSRIAQWSAR
jgi:hypothetical protein